VLRTKKYSEGEADIVVQHWPQKWVVPLLEGAASLITVEWRSLVDIDAADEAVFGILERSITRHQS